jgi:ring-1,2-phenylacetyl-CoA epoxidase subunit PaaC
MTTVSDQSAVFDLALSLADDALILGHRLSEWSSHAPMLEEDIALSNLALDLIGQARMFYTDAAAREARGRDEDKLAYFRSDAEYRNCLLVEQPNGDFAQTMARHLCYSAFMHPYFSALAASRDKGLAGIAAKAAKEMAYHRRHAAEWVIRLGDGTDESRARMIAGLDEMWGYTGELFEMTAGEKGLARQGLAPDRDTLRPQWLDTMAQVLREAGLDAPRDRTMQTGGRSGRHSEHLSHLLGDMQVLARAHPEAKW